MNEGWKTTLAALSIDLLQNNLSQTDLVNEKKKRPLFTVVIVEVLGEVPGFIAVSAPTQSTRSHQ